ncbi:MAG: translation initiation factor IF-2 [Nanoarchaeota archaeon]
MRLRSVICTVLGHVDHGKSSILDTIRGSAIVKSEAGQITQAIGASIIPLSTVENICGPLLAQMNMKFTIPGLLFIDTPGHQAFTHLRKRGGNIADIAILVVDINEGFMPQTIEAIEILRHAKTPFVVAANKIDLIPGWKKEAGLLLQNIQTQSPEVQGLLDTRLYTVVGSLSEHKFDSERYDRVEDYSKQVAIVPCSAKTGNGIPELLMVLTGLAQRYLEVSLNVNLEGPAKGTILEIKKDKGLGTTLDVILYDGTLKRNDTIVIGTLDEPIVTKVKALFEPAPLAEMRDKKSKFVPVDEVRAATGVKISAMDIDNAVAGMPIMSADDTTIDAVSAQIKSEVQEVLVETAEEGIVVKADSLGSLEALISIFKEKGVSIRKASIGNITRKDVLEGFSSFEKNPLNSAVLGFNVEISPEIESMGEKNSVKILTNNVIYRLVEEFEAWQVDQLKRKEAGEIESLVYPCKIQLLRGYVFRQSNPAIIGSEVLAGKLKTGIQLMKEGKVIGYVKGIQHEKENLSIANAGMKIAVSIENATVGRQIHENDLLYAAIPEEHFRKLKELKKFLSDQEINVLKEVAIFMRKENPLWGI